MLRIFIYCVYLQKHLLFLDILIYKKYSWNCEVNLEIEFENSIHWYLIIKIDFINYQFLLMMFETMKDTNFIFKLIAIFQSCLNFQFLISNFQFIFLLVENFLFIKLCCYLLYLNYFDLRFRQFVFINLIKKQIFYLNPHLLIYQ